MNIENILTAHGINNGGVKIKSIQSGTASLASTSLSVTIAAVDLTKAIVVFSFSSNSTSTEDFGQQLPMAKFNSSTALVFSKTNSSYTTTISWYVIEFESGVKVQRITGENAAVTTVNTAISQVDLSKTFVLCSCLGVYGVAAIRQNIRAHLTNSTTLQTIADYTGSHMYWSCFVVEFL